MKLSVVIATHARPASLRNLLESLLPQIGTDGRRELIVAENGTPRPSPLPFDSAHLRHLHDPLPGKCRIQNCAITTAQSEILVFLDDDLTAEADYLDRVETFFREHPEFALMKGRILPACDPDRVVGPEAVYLDLPLADEGESVIEVRGVIGANMAFRRSVFERAGLFDERLGPGAAGHEEETEMSRRARRAGFRIGYAPRAIVLHEVDPTRADRDRFLRVARERGRCRMLHEHHSIVELWANRTVARLRLSAALAVGARKARIAREERRLAVARGMLEGRRHAGPPDAPLTSPPKSAR